jgi:large subunit ribosomal protein L17
MIHGQKTKQLGRERNARNAMLKTMAVSLVRDGKIQTTETKAKVLRPIVEKLITKAKEGGLTAQRLVSAKIGPASAKVLVNTIAPKYKDRNGGYLRITKLNDRKGDSARLAQIEFV